MSIKLVMIDVDGVMCNGKIYNDNHVTIGKIFNDLDFTAIKCFKALDIKVILLTSDMFNLGMAEKRHLDFYNGRIDGKINKSFVYENIKKAYDVIDDEVVYIGDDRFDLPVLEKVKFAFCPYNSPNCLSNVCTVLCGKSGENLISEMFDWFVTFEILKEPSFEDLVRIDCEDSK